MLLRNEKCSLTYTSDFLQRLYEEEGKGLFTARSNILGHLQQGLAPSPADRIAGVKYATRAVEWLFSFHGRYVTVAAMSGVLLL